MATALDDASNTRRFDRLSDILREPHCWLLPLEGYQRVPLVSLETAIEPLFSIVADIKRKSYIARQSCGQPADRLSPDESASIMLYTMDWEPADKCLYFRLNKCLRDKQRENLKPWYLFLKLFLTALDKLPSLSCIVFRGVKTNLTDKYQQNSTIIWWGFSSCTNNINILQSKKFFGKTGDRTLFAIECSSGKDIRRHSYYQYENEILLPPARQFSVVGSLDQGNGSYLVQLKEVEPIVVLIEPVSVETYLSYSVISTEIDLSSPIPIQKSKLDTKINQYQHSSKVNLTFEELTDQDMPIIVKEIIAKKDCKELDLTNNRITSHGLSILASALQNNTTLKSLSLLSNHISDEGIPYLTEILSASNSTLTTLGLGSNDITDDGLQWIAQMLLTNQTLIVLTLQNNQISSRGVKLLMDALTRRNRKLAILNISLNTLINDSCVDSIVRMLTSNQTLKELYIVRCSLSPTSISKIQRAAKRKRGFQLNI